MQLVKSFKSVQAKFKEFYILYELQEDSKHTGGFWYNNETREFEQKLVDTCTKAALNYVKHNMYTTIEEVQDHVNSGSLVNVRIEKAQIEEIMNTLKFDGEVENWKHPIRTREQGFRHNKYPLRPNGLTDIPCGKCSIANICSDAGIFFRIYLP